MEQTLASYLGNLGKFSISVSVVSQATTGRKLLGKNHGKFHGTQVSDATHSTTLKRSAPRQICLK